MKRIPKTIINSMFLGALIPATILPNPNLGAFSLLDDASEPDFTLASMGNISLPVVGGTSLVAQGITHIEETYICKFPKRKLFAPITAYSSSVDETDSTPFITASGRHVRDGVVAANFLSMGSKIQIPKLFGNKVLVVADRMNARFLNRIDIWMPSKSQAREFGLKVAEVLVIQ